MHSAYFKVIISAFEFNKSTAQVDFSFVNCWNIWDASCILDAQCHDIFSFFPLNFFRILILTTVFLAFVINFFNEIFVYLDQYCKVYIILDYLVKDNFNFTSSCIQTVVFSIELIDLLFFFIFKWKIFSFIVSKFDFF